MSEAAASNLSAAGREALLRYEKSLDCVHCGLCLSSCPTYRETGHEVASPRGRIYVMRGVAEERLALTGEVRAAMELCLMCRACETVCPSDVEFGRMMEITRHEMHERRTGGRVGRAFRSFFLDRVLVHPRRVRMFAAAGRAYRGLGLAAFARVTGLRRLLPRTLRAMEASLPESPPASARRPLPAVTPAAAGVTARGRVALLEGCVMPPLFGDVNHRTVQALAAQGYEVVVPRGQTCCGALHAHSGDLDGARALARRNLEVFADDDIDHVVMNSAGCGAALKEYGHWFEEDAALAATAAGVAKKTVDILVLFEREGLTPRGAADLVGRRVTYDAPCHLHHAQRAAAEPVALLQRIPDLDLVPLPGAERCCGAAGIYNLTHGDMSRAILDEKLDELEATGAEVLLTGNPGCLLQWRKGIAERGLDVEVRHPVELL